VKCGYFGSAELCVKKKHCDYSLLYNYTTWTLLSCEFCGGLDMPSDSRDELLHPTGPWKEQGETEKPKRLVSCSAAAMLPLDQHSQLKAELGKHLLSGAIFLMLISLIARAMWGDICIRSIRLTLGASRIAFGGETAYWIAQMARGRMYTRDL